MKDMQVSATTVEPNQAAMSARISWNPPEQMAQFSLELIKANYEELTRNMKPHHYLRF